MDEDRDRDAGRGLSDDEVALFRKAVDGARPLGRDRIESPRGRVEARARFRRADDAAALAESLSHTAADQDRLSGERLAFRRPGLSLRAFRKLSQGGYRIEAETDLHGLTATQARRVLADFLNESRSLGYRCVRVVHGKGKRSGQRGPVLKHKVDGWLRQWDSVLAFASTRPAHGGTGAVYVLLRET